MSAIADSLKSVNKLWVPLAVGGGITLLVAVSIPNLLRSRTAADEAQHASLEHMYESTRGQNLTPREAGTVSLASTEPMAVDMQSRAPGAAKAATTKTDRKIVRTGALELTVKSPADAAEQIRVMAEGMGGYLESTQIGGTKDAPIATLTIRVPAPRFEDAKATIRKLAARVESEKTDAQDMTREYVDMEARLRNLRAEEAQYLTILKSAYKVEDLLSVSQKLSEVRGEIEQQQAEFQTLSKQVETVAITISLRAVADAQVFGLNWRPLYQLKVATRDALEGLAEYAATMTAVLLYVPVVLAWLLTIFFAGLGGWRLVRWAGRRFFAWPAVSVLPKTGNAL